MVRCLCEFLMQSSYDSSWILTILKATPCHNVGSSIAPVLLHVSRWQALSPHPWIPPEVHFVQIHRLQHLSISRRSQNVPTVSAMPVAPSSIFFALRLFPRLLLMHHAESFRFPTALS